jgi:hypothetical protein
MKREQVRMKIDFDFESKVFQWKMLNSFRRESNHIEVIIALEFTITYLNIGFGIGEILNGRF